MNIIREFMYYRSLSNDPKCICGHHFNDHGSTPPHTGYMWCEGAGFADDYVVCLCREYDGREPRNGWPWKVRR